MEKIPLKRRPAPLERKLSGIAKAIHRDLTSETEKATNALAEGKPTTCFACGASFIYRRLPDRNGRFCSIRCQDAYDLGHDFQPMRPNLSNKLTCPGCKQEFTSTGLRCCSEACERKVRRREELAADMAASGVKLDSKRRPCEVCGTLIPRFRKGRAVPSSTRFCSRKCRRRASKMGVAELQQPGPGIVPMAPRSPEAVSGRDSIKKPLKNRPCREATKTPSPSVEAPSAWMPSGRGEGCPDLPDFLSRR